MKGSILESLRVINDDQKRVSDELLTTNSGITKMVNSRILEVQAHYFNNLSSNQQQAVIDEISKERYHNAGLSDLIELLDINNPVTEPTEIRLDREKLSNSSETTRKIGNLLDLVVGDLGRYYNTLTRSRDYLDSRNALLTEQHIDNINTGIEIDKEIEKNRGSLIDDYADTSTEMPSYIDPDD